MKNRTRISLINELPRLNTEVGGSGDEGHRLLEAIAIFESGWWIIHNCWCRLNSRAHTSHGGD